MLEPFHLCAWLAEELHLHLLKLTHTEDELTCNDLVTECLTDLSDTERDAHTACLLNIKVIHEDTLRSLGTEVDFHCTVGSRTHVG